MFRIDKSQIKSFNIYKIHNEATGEYFSFLEFGATMHELFLKSKSGNLVSILDANTDFENLETIIGSSYKGSILAPFPNRINHGAYTFEGKTHQLFKNFPHEDNAIHGLVYNKIFKITSEKSNNQFGQITATYEFTKAQGFEFPFEINITYKLSNEGLSIDCNAKAMEGNLPFGLGWHPYFKLEDKIDNLSLSIPSKSYLEVDGRLIPTMTDIPYENYHKLAKLNDTKFDTCFRIDPSLCTENQGIIVIKNEAKNYELKIIMETGDEKYKFIQIYTPPARDCIAIEPMTCAPDALNNNDGLLILGSKDFNANFQIVMD